MKPCRNNAQNHFNPFFLMVSMCPFLSVATSSTRRQNLSREDSW